MKNNNEMWKLIGIGTLLFVSGACLFLAKMYVALLLFVAAVWCAWNMEKD